MITTAVAPGTEPGRRPARDLFAVWAVSFGVLIGGSWVPAWSGDEAATVMVVRRTLTEVVRTAAYDPALQPYYLLLNLWATPSTGSGWLRLTSVVAMATAVTLTAALGTRLLGRYGGLVAGVVMLALPATSRYGHDLRPYALSVLLAVAVAWSWSGSLDRWSRRAALAALVAALGLVQPYGLLLVPVLLVTSALLPRLDRRSELTVLAGCCGAGILVISPYLLMVARRAIGQVDPPPLTVLNLVEEVLRLPVGQLSPPLAPLSALLVISLGLLGVVLAWRRPEQRRLAVLVTAWLLIPPGLLCLLQVVGGGPGLVARYWSICLPALALGVAAAVIAVGARQLPVGVALLVLVVVLAVPTQLGIRTVDGHLGQRWRDLSAALGHSALRGAPLLAEGWSYRALVSNDPGLADRMVLVVDPAPQGRINPQTHSPGSPAFRRRLAGHGRVVVLQGEQGYSDALPRRRSFADFQPELAAYPSLAVRCAYFGEPLGVFTTTDAALTVGEAEAIAQQIRSVAPDRVHCAVGDS